MMHLGLKGLHTDKNICLFYLRVHKNYEINYLYTLIKLGFTVYSCCKDSSDDSAANSIIPTANNTQLKAEEAETQQKVNELRRCIDYGDA
jgi:hypothetical protein